MMKIGIIGCGTIAATYFRAFSRMDGLFEVTALYDVRRENAQGFAQQGIKICSNMEELLDCSDVECVIIGTPLHTHVQIAQQCLRKKKHVLLEKPAALDISQIRGLFDLADQMGVIFYVMFHSAFGVDIDWYLSHLGQSGTEFCTHNIRRLECSFFDPYMSGGVVQEDRKALGGSYIDSGVNILSVCSRLVPIEKLQLHSHAVKQASDGTVFASETVYSGHHLQVVMRTGWDKGLNQKRTLMYFEGTDVAVLLDHTDQSAWTVMPDGAKSLLFRQDDGERLSNQYITVFQIFSRSLTAKAPAQHCSQVLNIHKLLLCIGEKEVPASAAVIKG